MRTLPTVETQRWSRRLPAGAFLVATLFVLLCGLILGNFWLLGWTPEEVEPEPVRFEATPCSEDCVPSPLAKRLGPEALERLTTLNDRRALDHTPSPNVYAGAPLVPFSLGEGDPGALPQGMFRDLCLELGLEDSRALEQRLMRRAEQSLRDPQGRLEGIPGLRERVRLQVLAGAQEQLAELGARIAESGPIAHRPRVVIRGQARQANTFVIGQEHAAEREAATFTAWADLVAESLEARGLPVLRFRPRLEHGRYVDRDDAFSRSVGVTREWVEGWFDWKPWLEAVARGEDPGTQPFHELGRLLAIQVLNEAALVEVVFLGHGVEVGREAWEDGRYQPFRVGAVTRGDEFQEVLNLRRSRNGLTLRYGACLDARAPFWAASCSNRQGGETRPDQSTTAVAFLLENGWYPDAASLDPFVFRSYRALQAALLEAQAPEDAAKAVRSAVLAQQSGLNAPGELRSVLALGGDAWLLRAGGSETPDLLLVTGPGWRPDRDDALRIVLATSAWVELEALPGSNELVPMADWDPCAEANSCASGLEALLPQARRYADAGLPPDDASARYQAGGFLHRHWIEPVPDASHRFVRIAVLRGEEQSVDAYAEELAEVHAVLREALAQARARRRIQGFVLAEPDGTPMAWPD